MKWHWILVFILSSCSKSNKCTLSEVIFSRTSVLGLGSLDWDVEDLLNSPLSYDSIRCKLWITKPIDYIKVDNHYLPVSINWECEGVVPELICFRRREVVKISFDSCVIKINNTICPDIDLDSIFYRAYSNNGKDHSLPSSPNSCFIALKTEGSSPKQIELVLQKLIQGYVRFLVSEIGDLEGHSGDYVIMRDELRNKFPFRLNITLPNR